MRAFWALFWGVLVGVLIILALNSLEIYGWGRFAIVAGGVIGVTHTIYNYEDIACTCDDPDHEH